jgi:hypothetical protein
VGFVGGSGAQKPALHDNPAAGSRALSCYARGACAARQGRRRPPRLDALCMESPAFRPECDPLRRQDPPAPPHPAPRSPQLNPPGSAAARSAGRRSAVPRRATRAPTSPGNRPSDRSAAPRPPIAPRAARPRLRSEPSGSAEVMIASVAGETTAPPKPCSARAPISIERVSASAQASEDMTNRAVPATNTRRRPSRSADRPPSIKKPAKVIVYALTTH